MPCSVKPDMGENQTPSYAEHRKYRAEQGGKYLSAEDFPNGLEVKCLKVEIQPAWVPTGAPPSGKYQAVWTVTGPELEGEKFLKESGFMSGKLEELKIADPTGRGFLLSTRSYKANATFEIARAL